MKKRKSTSTQTQAIEPKGCCGVQESAVRRKTSDELCCEPVTDATICCDKTLSKEVNAQKTGCC